MPRRSILSAAEREGRLAFPGDPDGLIRHYTLSEFDLSVIRQRRGAANRLGFAVQLCYMRYPGVIAQGAQRRQHPQDAGRRADELRPEALGGVGLD